MAVATIPQPFEFDQLCSSNKTTFGEFLCPIKKDLEELEHNLVGLLKTESKSSREVIEYFFLQKGKRIRPAIFLYLCKIFSYKKPHKTLMACVSEYVHTASLLHDDVIDNSPTRRNKPTAYTLWGKETAILVGDLIYARASELMTQTGKIEIIASFANAIRQMSEGEIIQLEHIFDLTMDSKTYFTIISYKTASLLATSCKTAGILANLSQEKIQALESFGYNLGVSFQLIDDALDYLGDHNTFGKKRLKDLEEGKVTLPLILLKDKATELDYSKINRCFNQQKFSTSDVVFIGDLIKKHKTAEETIQQAKHYTQKALEQLDQNFEKLYDLEPIKNLALQLVQRIY